MVAGDFAPGVDSTNRIDKLTSSILVIGGGRLHTRLKSLLRLKVPEMRGSQEL
jgi:hypothetical protein